MVAGGETVQVLLQLALSFARAGLFTFGSGYAMLALIEREVVQRFGWLTPSQFADVVAISEVTPGPLTINMATFVGYRMAGLRGALAATLGLIAGPMFALLVIAHFYGRFRDLPGIDLAMRALRPVVTALILFAVFRMGRASISDWRTAMLFLGGLVALALRVHPLWVAIGGTAVGFAVLSLVK